MKRTNLNSSIDKIALKILALQGKPIKSPNRIINFTTPQSKSYNTDCQNTYLSLPIRQNSISISELEQKIKDPTEELLERHKNLVITSENIIKYIYDIFIGLLILYSTITSLFYLAFVHSTNTDYFTDIGVWLVFMIDFILSFFTSYKNNKGKEVKNLKMIAKKYTKTWMIPDLLSLLPLRLLFRYSNTEYCLRLLRFFKIKRYANLINSLKISRNICNFFRIESKLKRRKFNVIFGYSWELTQIFIFALIVCFGIASLWWYCCETIVKFFNPKQNFIQHFGLDRENEFTRALRTLHFVFSTMVTAGFGDYYSMNTYEMIINIIFILLGPSFFAYVMGSAIGIIRELHSITAKQNYSQEFNRWLSKFSSKTNKHIPLKLKSRINNFLYHLPKSDLLGSIANKSLETDSEEQIKTIQNFYIRMLPDYHKYQIMNFLFCEVFYCFKYFFGNDKQSKYILALYFQPRIYNQEVLLEFDEEVHEVLYVVCGTHQLESKSGEVLCLLDKSRIIGDLFCYYREKSWFTFRATGVVEGFAVPAHAFQVISKDFLMIEKYFDVVKENYERILDSEKASGRSWGTLSSTGNMNCLSERRLVRCESSQNHADKEENRVIQKLIDVSKRFKRMRSTLKQDLTERLIELIILEQDKIN